MDLYLLKFNNYYNRIVKLFDNLEGYMPYVLQPGIASVQEKNPIINVNFVPGDGVNTEQIINWSGETPDYIVATDPRTGAINSRWFIINTSRTRGGQYHLTLHRDVMADYYYDLLDAPTFIEKATLNADNPLIFNSEDMTFNQIKTSETLLKDASGCPWVVVYAAQKNAEDEYTTFNDKITSEIEVDVTISQHHWQDILKPDQPCARNGLLNKIEVYGRMVQKQPGASVGVDLPLQWTITNTSISNKYFAGQNWPRMNENLEQSNFREFQNKWETLQDKLGAYIQGFDPLRFSEWLTLNNKTVKVELSTGAKYYKISVNTSTVSNQILGYSEGTGAYKSWIDHCLEVGNIYPSSTTLDNSSIQSYYQYESLDINLQDISGLQTLGTYDILATRKHNEDAPYDLFCMPFSDNLKIINSAVSGFVEVTSSKELAFQFARAITTKYSGAGQVYDAQILPYCPIVSGEVNDNIFDLEGPLNRYTPIRQNTTTVGYILHASISSFSRNIQLNTPVTITEPKIQSQCDMYRLCSPNYNGIFEFNAAKNGGIQWFNVVCTYKPFNPYIKVYPNFGKLYGSDYNDQRGLICGGDFSLPVVTDAWKTYELQNKNYQNTFDRQIQNMEINNNIARIQERWQLATGVGSAALGGGNSGLSIGMAAGPIGGAIGAALGGTLGAGLSLAGGLMDIKYNEQLRQEAMSYAKDQFGYSLGNIRALPQSLSKTSAYNADNKYFPFLEYYTCTEEEKQALRDKIKYNGMTVMVIGTIRNYLQIEYSYIKGRLIRAEGIKADYNITNAIATEMFQGVFIK